MAEWDNQKVGALGSSLGTSPSPPKTEWLKMLPWVWTSISIAEGPPRAISPPPNPNTPATQKAEWLPHHSLLKVEVKAPLSRRVSAIVMNPCFRDWEVAEPHTSQGHSRLWGISASFISVSPSLLPCRRNSITLEPMDD